jgi:hypothetical protein
MEGANFPAGERVILQDGEGARFPGRGDGYFPGQGWS